MNKKTIILLILSTCLLLLTNCNISNDNNVKGESMGDKKRIVLIGASVGKSWNLPEFPQRINNHDHIVESLAVWKYDKTQALEEVLMRPKRKFRLTKTYLKGFFQPAPKLPDTIIIKECAAYFPAKLEPNKELVRKWVKRTREADIQIVLATVIPVTRERDKTREGQIEAIREYNDWIRDYAKKENIVLLDLELELREDADGRFLSEEFSKDGLHLNEKAYEILDKLLQDTLLVKS